MLKKWRSRRTPLILFAGVKRPLALAVLLSALALSVYFLPPTKVASTATCPTYETLTHYYSDASHTTRVGVCHTACDWRRSCNGTTSPYYVVENVDLCCGCMGC